MARAKAERPHLVCYLTVGQHATYTILLYQDRHSVSEAVADNPHFVTSPADRHSLLLSNVEVNMRGVKVAFITEVGPFFTIHSERDFLQFRGVKQIQPNFFTLLLGAEVGKVK
jgi:hypothetical protein